MYAFLIGLIIVLMPASSSYSDTAGLHYSYSNKNYSFSYRPFSNFAHVDIHYKTNDGPKVLCSLDLPGPLGLGQYVFSPSHEYLVFISGLSRSAQRRNVIKSRMIDIAKCVEVEEFGELSIPVLGSFSPDSRYYYLQDFAFPDRAVGRVIRGRWVFDLHRRRFSRLAAKLS